MSCVDRFLDIMGYKCHRRGRPVVMDGRDRDQRADPTCAANAGSTTGGNPIGLRRLQSANAAASSGDRSRSARAAQQLTRWPIVDQPAGGPDSGWWGLHCAEWSAVRRPGHSVLVRVLQRRAMPCA
jgi:hypothetical protein